MFVKEKGERGKNIYSAVESLSKVWGWGSVMLSLLNKIQENGASFIAQLANPPAASANIPWTLVRVLTAPLLI